MSPIYYRFVDAAQHYLRLATNMNDGTLTIGIHVRRTDKLDYNARHGQTTLGVNYYFRAMREMAKYLVWGDQLYEAPVKVRLIVFIV